MTVTKIDGAKQIKANSVGSGQLDTTVIVASGANPFTGDQSMGTHKLTNVVDGTATTDAATYGQLVALVNGLDMKGSVRVATTAAGTLATSFANGQVVDGVTLATGDSILLKNQATASENGVYIVAASGAPTRRTDADVSAEVTGGFTVWVNEGTTNGDSQWTLTTNDPITLGTTGLTFTQTDKNALTFSGGLTKTGNAVTRDDLTGDVTTTGNGAATTIAANAVTYAKLQQVAANSVVGNPTGATANAQAVAMASTATASTLALRDSNANVRANAFINAAATTATAASTTTLTVASAPFQQFTGTSAQTVVLPDATTLTVGRAFIITDRSTVSVTVNMNGGSNLGTVAAGQMGICTVIANGTAAGTWDFQLVIPSASGGLASSNFVIRETPSGTVNGSTTAFTLANTPTAGTEEVYLNGLLQEPGAGNDYTISGAVITFLTAPLTGDKIRVSYQK